MPTCSNLNERIIETSLGPVWVCEESVGGPILSIRPVEVLEAESEGQARTGKIKSQKNKEVWQAKLAVPRWLQHSLGMLTEVKAVGTPWQIKVWTELVCIPEGHQVSYGELAAILGVPKGARAVAKACASNQLMGLIPCHRVIGAKGPVGFAWGSKWRAAIEASKKLKSVS